MSSACERRRRVAGEGDNRRVGDALVLGWRPSPPLVDAVDDDLVNPDLLEPPRSLVARICLRARRDHAAPSEAGTAAAAQRQRGGVRRRRGRRFARWPASAATTARRGVACEAKGKARLWARQASSVLAAHRVDQVGVNAPGGGEHGVAPGNVLGKVDLLRREEHRPSGRRGRSSARHLHRTARRAGRGRRDNTSASAAIQHGLRQTEGTHPHGRGHSRCEHRPRIRRRKAGHGRGGRWARRVTAAHTPTGRPRSSQVELTGQDDAQNWPEHNPTINNPSQPVAAEPSCLIFRCCALHQCGTPSAASPGAALPPSAASIKAGTAWRSTPRRGHPAFNLAERINRRR